MNVWFPNSCKLESTFYKHINLHILKAHPAPDHL